MLPYREAIPAAKIKRVGFIRLFLATKLNNYRESSAIDPTVASSANN
jgi:hypothetical protein